MKITQQLKECLSYIAPPISKYDTREKNDMYVYDYMGRRYTEKVTWYSYSHDLTKNVTELYQADGLIASTYDYSPYGAATAEGTDQPIQYSSEYHDPELALTYYNYRHYNPTDGRWINRDPIQEEGGFNLYDFLNNDPIFWSDYVGLAKPRVAKRFEPSPCCKCGNATVQDHQYCENGKVKDRTKEKTTIYFGHCNQKLPDKVQKDKKSLKIGMVTCFADTTLDATVKDENRRLVVWFLSLAEYA